MSEPFYDIDIPRIERSAEAAIKRSGTFKKHMKLEQELRAKYPDSCKEPLDESRHFPFSPFHIANFLVFLEGMVQERKEKEKLRHAVGILISLLDPCECWLSHCEHCHGSAPMNCMAGKNPRTCPKAKAYREKKSADHDECLTCIFRQRANIYDSKRSFFKGYRCDVKRNADRPANCPKVKKESGAKSNDKEGQTLVAPEG